LGADFAAFEEASLPEGVAVTFFSFIDFAIATCDLRCKISETFLLDQIF
jgi:hypothetical protein